MSFLFFQNLVETTKEMFTKPISFQHLMSSLSNSFLLSELCPVNLLGRDLMCMLGMVLVSTSEGVKVSAPQNPSSSDFMEPADLHCTAHESPGPDRDFEHNFKGFFKDLLMQVNSRFTCMPRSSK
ncbi:hypothetical protein AMECASPLE_037155 [Ameca splendens]|uniref:Peptidase A2 domain-containing protein n=1 Tax=Ameca splendens TaxID=208324 RepID=A0ABV0YIZ1_9TELE